MQILKNFLLGSFVFCALAANASAQKPPKSGSKKPAKTDTKVVEKAAADKFSQALGTAIAENLKANGLKAGDINTTDMMEAMEAALKGTPVMDINAAQMTVTEKINGLQASKGKEAEGAGKQYLEQNKTKQGVITTASGLQYMVLTPGTGNKPTLTDKVKVHYHGTLIDGKVFDSSVDRGEPIAFSLNGVIQGWQEGVQLMQVGAKYRFFIPHELAYGSRPKGQIPPYSTLIFDVELLGINVE
jgi:FKBP-type peptidyl-prolyl cis-trans isomerase FklB